MTRKAIITKPGFYPQVTCDQYFAEPCPAPALTNSGIKLLAPAGAAPAKFAYHHPAIGQPPEERKETIATHRGKLVHRLALGKGQDYEVSPHERYQSNEAKAWKAEIEKAGIMPVKPALFEDAQKMAAVIRDRIDTAVEGHPYETEVVIAWQEETSLGPIWCRAMIDVWCPDLLLALDVKTCADAADEAVMRAFANGYATQHCFYKRGIERLTGEPGRARFGFLFVENEAPFLSRSAAPTEGFRHGAELEIIRARAIFADCLSRNQWPGYEAVQVSPPAWLINRWSSQEIFLEAAE